jgi:hypothetical protein
MAGGHLAKLTDLGIDCGDHYWITPRKDPATESWAQKSGIQTIVYSNVDGLHAELAEALRDLHSYVAHDEIARPVTPRQTVLAADSLPAPFALETMDAETIRLILNAKAVELLSMADEKKYERYSAFITEFNEAIYRAWYITLLPPKNTLLGYALEEELASGAFGTVYRAKSPSGDIVAIKVLHERIRNDDQMLQGFRRGVASMEILARHATDGVVAYRHASEIPALVVMDYIDGVSVEQAVQQHRITEWADVLSISLDLAAIIVRTHQLTERVLHRDIRPSNIMLRDEWEDGIHARKVIVLDFDLSWHRDAHDCYASRIC